MFIKHIQNLLSHTHKSSMISQKCQHSHKKLIPRKNVNFKYFNKTMQSKLIAVSTIRRNQGKS